MDKVWIIGNNGKQDEESFTSSQDAMNYAKQTSLRAMCCIHYAGKRVIFYEYGDVADAKRSKDLQEAVIEILEQENNHDFRDGQGKASRKKA
jgi:hypothetical protein